MSSVLPETATKYPYPGLRPFEPHEADIFFGRKRQVTDLLKRLKSQRFLAIVGPSGCGKSSLIRAGLIPSLEAGFMARSQSEWKFAILRPGNQPLLRLAEALNRSGVFGDSESPRASQDIQLRNDLEACSRSLADRLNLNEDAQGTNLLILVDQFEELFRFEREGGGDESRAFVNLLLETARDPDVSAYVVLTMRTDFLGQCPVFAGLPEALNDSQYLTPRLTREQIEEAIIGPARMFEGEIEQDVVTRILNEMGTDPDQLPLMQHLLMRLWLRVRWDDTSVNQRPDSTGRNYKSEPVVTMDDYTAAGGLAQTLNNHADKIFYARLGSDRQRELAEGLFRELTDVTPNGQMVRRSPAPEFSALCERLGVADPDELGQVINQFRSEGRSLLMPPPSEILRHDTQIDISHESLIRKWELLKGWTRDEARTSEIRREITKDAKRWDEGGRKTTDTTIPETRLLAALGWSQSHPRDATQLIRDFLNACRDDRERSKQQAEKLSTVQRQLSVLAGAAFVFLVLLGTVIYLWYQRGKLTNDLRSNNEKLKQKQDELQTKQVELQTKQKELEKQKNANSSILSQRYWRDAAQQFQGSSTTAKADDLAGGLVRLVEAYKVDPRRAESKELYEMRFSSVLAQHPKLNQLWSHPGVQVVSASGDGRFVLTAGPINESLKGLIVTADKQQNAQNEITIWDTVRGGLLYRLPVVEKINAAEFSRDGRYLLAATGDEDSTSGGLVFWEWPEPGVAPKRVGDKLLAAGDGVVAAMFLPSTNFAIPDIVAVQKGLDSDLRLFVMRAGQESAGPIPPPPLDAANSDPVDDSVAPTLVVSPDGRYAVTWSGGDRPRLWDLKNETAITGTLASQKATTVSCAFHSREDWLATVDRDGTARLWRRSTGELLHSWPAHAARATSVAFAPDFRHLVTSGQDNKAVVWEIVVEQPREDQSNPKDPSQQNTRVGREKPKAKYSVVEKNKFLHESWILAAKFSPDGSELATAGRDRVVHLWNVATGRPTSPPLHHGFSISQLQFSPDGLSLLTQMRDTALLWNLSCENPAPLALRTGDTFEYSVCSDNGQRVAAFGSNSTGVVLRLLDVIQGSPADEVLLSADKSLDVKYAALSADGQRVLAVLRGPQNSATFLWNSGRQIPLDAKLVAQSLGTVECAAFSADGRLIATASRAPGINGAGKSWQLQIWDTQSGDNLLKEAFSMISPINHIVWNKSGDRIIVSCGDTTDPKGTIGGAQLFQFVRNQPGQTELQPVGAMWIHPFKPQTPNAVWWSAFSPKGDVMATAGADDTAYLWKPEETSPFSTGFKHTSDIVHVTFSPDGKCIATSSVGDKKTCVWTVDSSPQASPKFTFEHNGRVNRAVFNHDNTLLATASDDGTAKVWNLTGPDDYTGDDLVAVFKHDGGVQNVAFADNERHVVTVSAVTVASWPVRRQWQLKPASENSLSFDVDELQKLSNLLVAGEFNPVLDIMQPLGVNQGSAGSEDATTKTLQTLWKDYRQLELSRMSVANPSRPEMVAADEAAEQWFAAAWHLNQEIQTLAPGGQRPQSPEQQAELNELQERRNKALRRYWSKLAADRKAGRQYQAALDNYQSAINAEGDPQLYVARAAVHAELRNWDAAIQDYTQAIQKAPTAQAYLYRAQAYDKNNNPQKVIEDLNAAIDHLADRSNNAELRKYLKNAEENAAKSPALLDAALDKVAAAVNRLTPNAAAE